MSLGAKHNCNLNGVFQSIEMIGKRDWGVQLQVRISIKRDNKIHGFNNMGVAGGQTAPGFLLASAQPNGHPAVLGLFVCSMARTRG